MSNRTVQSWLIALGKPSSRTCQPWAVKALKEYLHDPKNQPELEWLRQKKEGVDYSPSSATEMTYNRSVEIATREIEDEERQLESWKRTGLIEFPEKIFKELRRLNRNC